MESLLSLGHLSRRLHRNRLVRRVSPNPHRIQLFKLRPIVTLTPYRTCEFCEQTQIMPASVFVDSRFGKAQQEFFPGQRAPGRKQDIHHELFNFSLHVIAFASPVAVICEQSTARPSSCSRPASAIADAIQAPPCRNRRLHVLQVSVSLSRCLSARRRMSVPKG